MFQCYHASLDPNRRPTLHTDASGTVPPDAFGPFRVLHQIGAGTLGPIFRAYQPDPGRLVAVKQFRLGFSPESASRFVAALERIVAADLTHTGIAAPIAAGVIDTTPYLALDFVAADSLDVVIREYGPLPIGDILRFTRQLGRALDVAAGAGVLHGALHPRDLLMTADDVRVTGLGIAGALEEVGMTAPIRRPYSAPERCAAAPWDRRADVFSLAALTFEMLFGRPIAGMGADAADGITTIDGADSEHLHTLFSQALAADPAQRIATASAFVSDLRAILPSPERHNTGSRRKRGETVVVADSLFDAPLATPEPTADMALENNLFRNGDYVEGDARRTQEEPHAIVDTREVEVNLGAIDLRLDENVREGEELRLRGETEVTIQPAVAAADVVADVPFSRARFSGAETPRADADTAPAPLVHDFEEHEPLPIAPAVDDEVEPEIALPPARMTTFDAQEDDVPLSPVTPAYSSLPGEAPASSNWPILLGVVVGLLVGTAFGYVLGTRQHPDTTAAIATVSSSPAAAATSTPTTSAAAATASGAEASTPAAAPVASASAATAPSPTDSSAATGNTASPRAETRANATSASRPVPTRPVPTSAAPRNERPRPAPVAQGRLVVRSSPPGARVSVDGRDAGVTPATVTNLSTGAYNVRVSRDGYVTAERRVRIRSAQASQSIAVTLAAVRPAARPPAAAAARTAPPAATAAAANRAADTRGSLTVDSRPSGARVFIDGRQVGVTPMQLDAVDAGSHGVRLELDGFGPWATTVQVVGGHRARVSGSLER